VPVLDAEPIASADLDELDLVTRPTIVRQYDVPEPDGGGFSCGCASMAGGDNVDSKSNSVDVSAPVEVGPVTAVVLQADDASALSAWLGENGFGIPTDQEALVARYVRPGGAFIALRRSERTATNAPSSIGLHYTLPGDYRTVSLAFARLGAAPTVSFTVFVNAPRAVQASGAFVNFTLDDLDERLLESSYSKAVANAVASQRYAFVLEAAMSLVYGTTSQPYYAGRFSPHFAGLFEPGTLTRASTVMAADTLDTDATFDEVTAQAIPRTRTVGPFPLTRASNAGSLVLVFLVRAVRRRLAARAKARRT